MTLQDPVISPADALRQVGTLLRLVRALDQQLHVAAPDAASLAEMSVLSQVDHAVDLPSQVARALRMDPARVTHLVERLVTAGALTRTVDPDDRRCWRLRLTEAGKERLEADRGAVRAAMEALLAGLEPEERAALSTGLGAVRRVLDALPPNVPSMAVRGPEAVVVPEGTRTAETQRHGEDIEAVGAHGGAPGVGAHGAR